MRNLVAVCSTPIRGRPRTRSNSSKQPRSVAGTWRVDFVTPLGQTWVIMTINQSGSGHLTGHATDEYGEYGIDGRIVDDQVTVVWAVPEDGKMLEITMKGKFETAIRSRAWRSSVTSAKARR